MIYLGVATVDQLYTEHCLIEESCLEGNERATAGWEGRLRLNVLGVGAALALDRLMFEVFPPGRWVLRIGFTAHRGAAMVRIDVTW